MTLEEYTAQKEAQPAQEVQNPIQSDPAGQESTEIPQRITINSPKMEIDEKAILQALESAAAKEKISKILESTVQAMQTMKPQIEQATQNMTETFNNLFPLDYFKSMAEWAARMQEKIKPVLEQVQEARKTIAAFMQSKEYEQAKKLFYDFEDICTDEDKQSLYILPLAAVMEDWGDLKPFVKRELARIEKERGTAVSFAEFVNDTDPDTGEEIKSLLDICIERARDAKRKQGVKSTALTTIGKRLFVPSDPTFQNAFITSVSANIGLYKRDKQGEKKQLALNINTEFLRMLAQATYIDYLNGNKSDLGTSLYFPAIARELGYQLNQDPNEKKDANLEQVAQKETTSKRTEARTAFVHTIIDELNNIWGNLPNDSTEYRLISVLAYNPDTEILHFVSPYFQQLIKVLDKKETAQLDSGENYYLWRCELLHSSAANERNHAAVEMATRILVGVQQRGTEPDAQLPQNKHKKIEDKTVVSWDISCAGLIADCPQIREKLKKQTPSTQTQTIKRTFSAMYRILKEKTDLYCYYNDLQIAKIIPTSKTLNDRIYITHHGGNSKYKRPALPIENTPEI